MTWICKNDFFIEEHLYDKKIPHCISSSLIGNMKLELNRTKLISALKHDNLYDKWDAKNIVIGNQTHSDITVNVDDKKNEIIDFDAMYTKIENKILCVFTADCVPVFIVGDSGENVGLAHAGWRGVYSKIVINTIDNMRKEFLTKDFFVVIGPHIKSCCYEVSYEMRQYFPLIEENDRGEKKYFLNLENILESQLLDIGISKNKIIKSNLCTHCSDYFFSYRRAKTDNRMISLLSCKV